MLATPPPPLEHVLHGLRRALPRLWPVVVLSGFVVAVLQGPGAVAGTDPRARQYPWSSMLAPSKHPGVLTLANQRTQDEPWFGPLFADRDEKKLMPGVAQRMKDLFLSLYSGKKQDVNPELLELLLHLSDSFGGRQMCLISGYRHPKDSSKQAQKSQHFLGNAADIVILGIPNETLAEYLLWLRDQSDTQFKNRIGVGYYPNTYHVHVDVRGVPAYWIDVSGPGQVPQYISGTLSRPSVAKGKYRDGRAPKWHFTCQKTDQDERAKALGQKYYIPVEPEDQFLWHIEENETRFRWKGISLDDSSSTTRWGEIDFGSDEPAE